MSGQPVYWQQAWTQQPFLTELTSSTKCSCKGETQTVESSVCIKPICLFPFQVNNIVKFGVASPCELGFALRSPILSENSTFPSSIYVLSICYCCLTELRIFASVTSDGPERRSEASVLLGWADRTSRLAEGLALWLQLLQHILWPRH